jgi:hypothetical protein
MNDYYSDHTRAVRQARKAQRRGDLASAERWTKLARLYVDLDTADKLNAIIPMLDAQEARDLQRRWRGATPPRGEGVRLGLAVRPRRG